MLSHDYTGDGTTRVYAFDFDIFSTADVRCTLDGIPDGNYTVNPTEKTVEFALAPLDGSAITIYRQVELTHSPDYNRNGALNIEQFNADMNYIIEAMRDIQTQALDGENAAAAFNKISAFMTDKMSILAAKEEAINQNLQTSRDFVSGCLDYGFVDEEPEDLPIV